MYMHACLFKIIKKQRNGAAWKKDSLKAYDKKVSFIIYLFIYFIYLDFISSWLNEIATKIAKLCTV